MAQLVTPSADTWAGWDTVLGKRDSRKVGNNTYAYRKYSGYVPGSHPIAIELHTTEIATFRPDGWIVLRAGGWHTVTTRDRLSAVMPDGYSVYSVRGQWHIACGDRGGQWAVMATFVDGIAIREQGHPDGPQIGMSLPDRAVGVLFSAADIAAAIAEEDRKAAERAVKRADRLRREHPVPRDFAGKRLPAMLTDSGVPGPSGHPARGWRGGYTSDCESCRAEQDSWSAGRRVLLGEAHDNGLRMVTRNGTDTSDVVSTFPAHDTSRASYSGGCPWDCPKRPETRY